MQQEEAGAPAGELRVVRVADRRPGRPTPPRRWACPRRSAGTRRHPPRWRRPRPASGRRARRSRCTGGRGRARRAPRRPTRRTSGTFWTTPPSWNAFVATVAVSPGAGHGLVERHRPGDGAAVEGVAAVERRVAVDAAGGGAEAVLQDRDPRTRDAHERATQRGPGGGQHRLPRARRRAARQAAEVQRRVTGLGTVPGDVRRAGGIDRDARLVARADRERLRLRERTASQRERRQGGEKNGAQGPTLAEEGRPVQPLLRQDG